MSEYTIDDVLQEQERRKNESLARYNTGRVRHKKQLAFHKSLARNRWVFGGNRSGKTECGAVEAVWLALGRHPYRVNLPDVQGWVVSLTAQVQRDVAQAKILRYLEKRDIVDVVMITGSKQSPEHGVIDFILVRNVFGGVSRIGFKSCDQGRERFQGASLDFVWFDEEPPEDIYEECRMRVMDRKGILFGTMTPLKGRSWVYDKIYLSTDEDVWWESMQWADNPYLDKEEIDFMTKSMSEEELRSRRYGEFQANGGLVYSEFDPAVHVIDPFPVPKSWYAGISIDPGLRNPLSAHWYAVDGDGAIYVIAEHYEAGRPIDYHADRIKATCKLLDWHARPDGRYEALIDSAAQQRTLSAEKSVCELFFEQGIAVNPKVNKDVFSGIARVKAALRPSDGAKPNLYIFSTCTHLLDEIRRYVWDEGDHPKKVDDHAMDDLRYFVCSRPKPAHPEKPKKSLVQLEKEKLCRRASRGKLS